MNEQVELSQHEVEQRLMVIASRLLEIDFLSITPESKLEGDIPFDSLGIAEFMMEVEEAFDIEIPEGAHEKMFPGQTATVRTLATVILDLKG